MKVTRFEWSTEEIRELSTHSQALDRMADALDTLRESALIEIAEMSIVDGFTGSSRERDLLEVARRRHIAAEEIRHITSGRTRLEHVKVVA